MNHTFNIQLFAENLNTTATMSQEMKTFYEKRLIDQAEPRLVHDQFADYYPVPQNGGKTIEFRKYDSLPKASTPLTEGVTPNGQTLNVTTITSDLHQYGGWTPLTDVLQMTAIDNNVVQATRVLASQAGRTMDSITRDVLAGGTNVIYAPKLGADGAETAVTSRKALVGIGTKILIFPDKLAFDTADGSVSALGAAWKAEGQSVQFTPCDAAGKTYQPDSYGREEPEKPADGQLFLKVEDEEHPWSSTGTLEVYSTSSGNWTAVPLDYCRITAAGAQKLFAQWDTVTVSGTAAQQAGMWEELNGDLVVYDLLENGLRVKVTPKGECFYGTLVQGADSARWTSLDGKETRSFAVSTPVRMERRVPDLDYITECDNRVWGCSSKENVIYACKLGDPTNWFSYRGIAADSYAVTVGSDGAFTGAATCMGYALFFKENTLHKLYGSKPSDFQLTSLRCRGVAKNAARSLCVLNETLYYLSPDGVMAWDGSIPTKVSGVLDSGRLSNVQSAVGGALDGRYYLHIARAAAGEGVARLLVYDTERALWSEEDVCSYEMTSTGGQLYLWDGQALWAADPSRETDWQSTDGVEEKLNFELVTGDIGLDGAEDRYLSRLTLRLDAECGSTVTVAASYDGGPWETVAELAAQNVRRSYDMPFVPRRHGTLRLRLKGRGQITLRSIAKTVAAAKGGITGGEV